MYLSLSACSSAKLRASASSLNAGGRTSSAPSASPSPATYSNPLAPRSANSFTSAAQSSPSASAKSSAARLMLIEPPIGAPYSSKSSTSSGWPSSPSVKNALSSPMAVYLSASIRSGQLPVAQSLIPSQ